MSDLVERLRGTHRPLCIEAADEIARLRKERDEARDELVAVYTATGLDAEDRCPPCVEGLLILERSAIRVQQIRAEQAESALAALQKRVKDGTEAAYCDYCGSLYHDVSGEIPLCCEGAERRRVRILDDPEPAILDGTDNKEGT